MIGGKTGIEELDRSNLILQVLLLILIGVHGLGLLSNTMQFNLVGILFSLVMVVSAGIGLYGSIKRHHGMLRAYVIIGWVLTAVQALLLVVLLALIVFGLIGGLIFLVIVAVQGHIAVGWAVLIAIGSIVGIVVLIFVILVLAFFGGVLTFFSSFFARKVAKLLKESGVHSAEM